jgi:hypothetical protein
MISQGKLILINLPNAELLLSSFILCNHTHVLCSLKLIEKTIVAANLGVTPSNDGEVIRVTVPPLTSDRRKVCVCKFICALHFFHFLFCQDIFSLTFTMVTPWKQKYMQVIQIADSLKPQNVHVLPYIPYILWLLCVDITTEIIT